MDRREGGKGMGGRRKGKRGIEGRRTTYLDETKTFGPVELILDDGYRNDATVRPEHVLDVLLAHLEGRRREGGWEGGEGSEISRYDPSHR